MSGRRLLVCVCLAACALAPAGAAQATPAAPLKHIFLVMLENENYHNSFEVKTNAPYLSQTLPQLGELLTKYYGIAHESLPNYVALISGQAPNFNTQGDCNGAFTKVFPGTQGADEQIMGSGCEYPDIAKTVANQLEARGLGWKGYMEDMELGRTPAGATPPQQQQAQEQADPQQFATTCRHPSTNMNDFTQTARNGDEYAARHDPFVYFDAIIGSDGNSALCNAHVVPLTQLKTDLVSAATTPAFAMISPNLCNDGHDATCSNTPNNAGPVDAKDSTKKDGGYSGIDAWLRIWIPTLLHSPAYADDGAIIVTFDEADQSSDQTSCCSEPTGPNTPAPGIQGAGGGRVGAIVLSPWVVPGSQDDTAYNHYSLLRTVEDAYGLDPLGYADQAHAFGKDVFNRDPNAPPPVLPNPPTAPPPSGNLKPSGQRLHPRVCIRPKLQHHGRGRQRPGTLLGSAGIARRLHGKRVLYVDVFRFSRLVIRSHRHTIRRTAHGCRTYRIALPRGAKRAVVLAKSGRATERRTVRTR